MDLVPGQKIWGLEWQAKDEAERLEHEARERVEEERRQSLRELKSHPYYQRHFDDVIRQERERLTALHEAATSKLHGRWAIFSFVVLPLALYLLPTLAH